MYGVIAFLPFGIFGWLQNEDGLMEWGSVALLILSAINAFRLQKQSQNGWERMGWLLFFVLCCLFIGEEISWGDEHGAGIDASARSTPREKQTCTTLPSFKEKVSCISGGQGLVWFLALEGLSSKLSSDPARRSTLYFTLPGIWYLGFEFCRKADECFVTVANHQEIYELLIIAGLYLHTRSWCRKRGIKTRLIGAS